MKKNKSENLKVNFIYNLIHQIVVVVAPLLITPKLSRVFGVDYIGIKSYTYSIVYYFAVFGVLGLDLFGQRQIAVDKDNEEKRTKIFWTVFVTRCLLLLFSTIIYFSLINVFSSNGIEKIIFCCWGLFLLREAITPTWFLQGIEKYKTISIFYILSQVLYVVFTLVFINEKDDLPMYILFFNIIPLFISIILLFISFKYVGFAKIKIDDMKFAIKESIPYFIPTIATAVYSMIDKTMLSLFDKSKESTGLYESAEKLVKVAITFSTASYTIIRTRMSHIVSKKNNEQYKYFTNVFISLSMFLCWPIMFGIIGLAKDFVPIFFGAGFENVVNLTYVFALVIPCLAISGLLHALFIFPYGLQKQTDKYYILVALLNCIFNLILISLIGVYGAIIASVFSELILVFVFAMKAKNDIKISLIFRKSIKYIISSLIMLFSIFLISKYVNTHLIFKIIIEFVVGFLSYIIMCLILFDEFIITITKKILHKIFIVFSKK